MDRFVEDQLDKCLELLDGALTEDNRFLSSKVIEKTQNVVGRVGSIFIKYIIAVNQMMFIYPYMLHPLKRRFFRATIDRILGRIVELKQEMVEIECCDFQYLNNVIICHNISRVNASLIIPAYYAQERKGVLEELHAKIYEILKEKELREIREAKEREEKEKQKKMVEAYSLGFPSASFTGEETEEQGKDQEGAVENEIEKEEDKSAATRPVFVKKEVAVFEFLNEIKLIQRHERARATRLYVQSEKERIHIELEKAYHRYVPIPERIQIRAVRVMQQTWRNYRQRMKEKYRTIQNRIIYGTLKPSFREPCKLDDLEKERQSHQMELEKKMENAMEEVSKEIELRLAADIKADMLDELRDWIYKWYECTKEYGCTELPLWPTDDCFHPQLLPFGIPVGLPKEYIKANFSEVNCELQGCVLPQLCGSELISAGHWIATEKYPPAAEEARKHAFQLEKPVDLERLQEEKEAKEREEAERIAELKRIGHIPWKSVFFPEVKFSYREYITEFLPGRDLEINPEQEFELERIKDNVIYDMRRKFRKEVDAQIRDELEVLQSAIDADEVDKPKPGPFRKPKKKGREKKKRKKRGKRDPLANRSVDSLYVDLVEDGIIVEREEVKFESLEGTYNHHSQDAEERPLPGFKDLYDVANLYITLPLCSADIRSRTTPIKSVLLAGPGYYTKPLVNAIATTSGSLLFHLNTVNFECRLQDKFLVSALLKVSRECQPSIILIESAEKAFYKKVPKEERELNLNGLKKVVGPLVKGINEEDRIVVIGTAEAAWLSNSKIFQVFDKVLPFADIDFHHCSTVVQQTVMKYHGVDREFNTAVPAFTFLGHPLSEVEKRIDSVFDFERQVSLKYLPLRIDELGALEKEKPPASPLEPWYQSNYPLCIQRAEMIEAEKNPRPRAP